MSHLWLVLSALLVEARCHTQCAGVRCTECVLSGDNCSWCSQANFSTTRCQPKKLLIDNGCENKYIEEAKSFLTVIKNENLTDVSQQDNNNNNNNVIQIQPQKILITTWPRRKHRISLTYRAANNFPVDLYFLFDYSKTMEDHLKNLANLANDIGQSLSNISNNFLVGYGVFQDKVILPFTDTIPEQLKNPCRPSNLKCAPPIEFMHLLNMTKNITEFRERVNKTRVSSNLDPPEGSIDAIVQAVACKSEIGWRTHSHKLLIFASNDRFHLAGDGRLGGVVIPNDGQCHLDTEGRYTKELEQDYPSVSQMIDIVSKNEVNIIFAVTRNQVSLFKKLSSRIPNSIVELLADSNDNENLNIKQIIEKKYKEMLSEVEIVHNKVQGIDIEIKATSEHCEGKGTNKCKSLSNLGFNGTPITFDADVKVTECPSSQEQSIKQVIIYPATMRHDQLVLEIDTNCECSCNTDPEKWELNSEKCAQGNGTLKCGLCDCQLGRLGNLCECDPLNTNMSNSGCIWNETNSTEQCSGAGKCECGQCKCNNGYSGQYCECYDQSCGYFRKEVCGGTHGNCVCGKCVCEPEYTGTTCECPTSNLSCIYEETVCNNAGSCDCGECRCKKGYIGIHCENCFLCDNTVCDIPQYQACAECAMKNKKDECPESCPEIKLVNTLDNIDGSDICTITQADGCLMTFHIMTTDASIVMLVRKTSTCPESVNAMAITVGVFGAVVVVGILLILMWKICITIFDRIKYSRFQEDMKKIGSAR